MSDKLSPAARGYAPDLTIHGDALSDIRDPAPQGVNVPVVTFEAYDKASGEKVVVDDRTFDAERHSLEPVALPAADA